jgi:hypothetical protein
MFAIISMLENEYLDTSKVMSDGMIPIIIEHYSFTLNDDVQAIITDMVQDWIREVNRYFGRASHGE